ncbi:MAG: hypothetical protein K1000chlam1_01298 [Candidatus Anoxychlamydiales bacterium]|nr:hypothetical protein [Candidatus Anoxychlamydiales bacterium]
MEKKVAALIYGENIHFLDHLAPLCYFFDIPLITNSEKIFELTKKFYPKVKIQHIEGANINFYIVENFDNIVTCITKEHFDSEFRLQQDVLNKEVNIVWCPHGNSDKGRTVFFMEALKDASNVLVYGDKMIDFLKEKKIFKTIKNHLKIGNYRFRYFQEFSSFFKNIIKNDILKKLPKGNTNILYAPTWQDAEKSSSFFKVAKNLFKQLPSKYNLIVKLHPNLIDQNKNEIEKLKERYKKNNILFLDDFPPIYPILDFVDVYLGDFSSIGYDFLTFDKPLLFFKPQNEKLISNLFDCSKLIKDENKIFETIEKSLQKNTVLQLARQKLYKYTFEDNENINFKILKKTIFN